jgi:hypothetical protein
VGRQNIKIFLQFFYLHIWPIAKFGEIFLWMIAILATSQSWEKKKKPCQG